jgi:hypothetical protein
MEFSQAVAYQSGLSWLGQSAFVEGLLQTEGSAFVVLLAVMDSIIFDNLTRGTTGAG